MKIIKKLLLLTAVLGATLISCNNTGDSDELALTKETPTTEVLPTDVSALKVGAKVSYGGAKYLVTKNTLPTVSANRAVLENIESSSREAISEENESAEEIAKNVEYINRYLTNDFRAKLLKQEFDLTEYIELFPVGTRKETGNNGLASLNDNYLLLNAEGKKIAKFRQKWQSNSFSNFYFGVRGETEETEKFNSLTEEELREYDPLYVDLYYYPKDLKDWKQIEFRYNYYVDSTDSSSEHYKKVNYESLNSRKDYFDFTYNSAGKERAVYRVDVMQNGAKQYWLLEAVASGGYTALMTSDYGFTLILNGEGKVGGTTKTSVYSNNLRSQYFSYTPIDVSSKEGDVKSICSVPNEGGTYTTDFSGEVEITKSDNTKVKVPVSEIGNNCDIMSVSTEKTTVNATEVPASMTYHAHYAKNKDGTYPTKDKYTKVTCYPVYDEANSRIIYKVTEKSIEDYINAYKADFATLTAE